MNVLNILNSLAIYVMAVGIYLRAEVSKEYSLMWLCVNKCQKI